MLQQYLPLAVLKRFTLNPSKNKSCKLQQYLPLAVLKRQQSYDTTRCRMAVATVLTACGIETLAIKALRTRFDTVATVLTACGIETCNYAAFFSL